MADGDSNSGKLAHAGIGNISAVIVHARDEWSRGARPDRRRCIDGRHTRDHSNLKAIGEGEGEELSRRAVAVLSKESSSRQEAIASRREALTRAEMSKRSPG